MASVNKVILIGRLGRDPELKQTTKDPFCTFSLATQSNPKAPTQWHNITVWGKQAENCAEYLKRGAMAFIEGELQYRQYEKEGVKVTAAGVKAYNVRFLPSGGEKTEAPADSKPAFEVDQDAIDDSEIPF